MTNQIYDLSVIIPIYNGQNYLKKTLSNNLEFLKDCEVILVNDGSTDGSLEILLQLANKNPNIRIVNKKNGGVSSARNAGINIATGNYILFLDSDDLLTKNIFFLKELLKINMYDIIKFDYKSQRKIKFLYSSNVSLNHTKEGIINKNVVYYNFLTSTNFNSVWSQVVKRDVIADLRFDEKYKMAEDLDFNLKIYSKAKNIYYLPKKIIKYQYNGDSATRKTDIAKEKKQLLDILEIYHKLFHFNKLWCMNISESLIKQHIDMVCKFTIYKNSFHSQELLDLYRNYINERKEA